MENGRPDGRSLTKNLTSTKDYTKSRINLNGGNLDEWMKIFKIWRLEVEDELRQKFRFRTVVEIQKIKQKLVPKETQTRTNLNGGELEKISE